LLDQLFIKIPSYRLGGGPRGATEIKIHPWFRNINWKDLENKKIKPPFIPNLKNKEDFKYFDPVKPPC